MTTPRPHPKVGVLVTSLTGQSFQYPFVQSWTKMLRHDFSTCGHIAQGGTLLTESGPRIAEARSQQIRHWHEDKWLRERAEWHLMIDSDMAWEPHALCQLLGHAYEGKATAKKAKHLIIGGLCFGGGRTSLFPTIYDFNYATDDSQPLIECRYDYKRNALNVCDATGAAFLLVHTSVYAAMADCYGTNNDGTPNPYPWWTEGGHHNGHPIGEDLAFCIRAHALGIKVAVHAGVKVGHRKPLILDESFYDGIRRREQEQA